MANEIDDAVGEIFAGTEFMTAIAPVEAGGGPLPQAELLSMINHVQGEFIRQDNTVKAFGLLLDSLVELTRSESGIITELRPVKDETRVSVTAASSSLDPAEVRSIYGSADHLTWSKSFRDPFLRELVATRDAVVNNYVNPSASPLRGVKTIVSLPLITGNELIGAVSLMNRQVGYSRALIQQLQPMLRSAANAVEAYRQRQYLAWTERQLNNKANLQRAIMENALDGVIATSQDGTVMDFNPAAERIFGWSKAEVLGRDMGELFFPSEQNATARQAYDDYLESGTAKLMGRHFESRAKRRDGELFPVELAISEVEFDGDVIFVTFARDITKRRAGAAALQAAKQEAESASEAKSRFLATVSHEIRTPLNAICGSLSLLEHAALEKEEHKYVAVASESARVLTNLINDVLDFAKIEAGDDQPQVTDFFPAETLDSVIRMIGQRAEADDVRIASFVDRQVPYAVRSDSERVRQVLINLVGNAVKFSPGGNVETRILVLPDNRLRFEVRDDGIGIPQDQQELIFKEFEQAPKRDEQRHAGTGLGLAICRRLADSLGGEIGCESVEGEGSHFWFTLPFEPADGAEHLPGTAGEFKDLRVGILAPDAPWRQTLIRQLHAWEVRAVGHRQLAGLPLDVCDLLFVEASSLRDVALQAPLAAYRDAGGNIVVMASTQQRATGDLQTNLDTSIELPVQLGQLWHALASRRQAENYDRPSQRWQQKIKSEETHFVRGQRILLVDDSSANRLVGSAVLKRMGFVVDMVANGQEAVQNLQTLSYDIVVMDVDMPVMDGITATLALRESDGPNRQTPIIGMSAHATDALRQECLDAGMNEYLVKPFDRSVLIEVFTRYLKIAPAQSTESAKDSQPANLNQLLDGDTIRQLAEDAGREMMGPILRAFVDELQDRVDRMRAAVTSRDAGPLGAQSHALKSSAATFGFVHVAALATQINDAIREDRLAEAMLHFRALDSAVAPSIEALRRDFQQLLHTPAE